MAIKFDVQDIRCMNIFEKVTGVEVKDCVVDGNNAYFVVSEGKVGLVIGKNGKTIKRLQDSLNKKVRVFEYSGDLKKFLENLIPAKIENMKVDEENGVKSVEIEVDRNKRSFVLGKDGKNLKIVQRFLKREFNVEELKVE